MLTGMSEEGGCRWLGGWGMSKRDGLGLLAQGTPAKCLMTQVLTAVVFVHF